jgi:hypothetical protein
MPKAQRFPRNEVESSLLRRAAAASGDLHLCEWSNGWPGTRRFAVSLLDRVIDAPDGKFKVMYVAVPLSQ